MPRDHARFQTRVWNDRDWRRQTIGAQHMYWTLCSQPTLSYCGAMDWWPGRLAQLAKDADEETVYAAIKELLDGGYVLLDAETNEILVRSYVRHDRVLERANMGKAMGRALEQVVSLDLHDAVMVELARLYKEDKSMLGFQGFRALYPKEYEAVISMALAM